jgi:hypothetical protein
VHAVAATDRSEQPATLESTMTNLAHRLLTSASADPSALAIRLDDVTLSYADLAGASCRLAKHVTDRGLQPGTSSATASSQPGLAADLGGMLAVISSLVESVVEAAARFHNRLARPLTVWIQARPRS